MTDARETGTHDPSPRPLAGLLRELFDADELRIHLASEPDGASLVGALPGAAVSLELLTFIAAEALKRRGLVSRDFFDRLEVARPHRRDAIRKARNAWFAGVHPEAGALWGDRYRLDVQLGDGGFGSVWRAVDEQSGQFVALKVLHRAHIDNPRIRKRFFRGAHTLAGLSHPSIVRVHAAALEAGLHSYYVMEYIRGATLDTCVRERRYPRSELIEMALQIGDALIHVHQRGLLHRDVKPANILITDRKLARLIDFDLVTGDDFVALTTEAVGTQLYMPPEAHTSDSKTGAYDVFSLARTIELILRGREPTVRELADVADIDASADVRAILRAALQPDPQRRIAQMATFCAVLRAALAAEGSAPPRPRRSWPSASREPSSATRPYATWCAAASIVGHLAVTTYLAPPREHALFLFIFFTGPSIRVFLDRERNRYLTILHVIWMGLWSLPVLVLLDLLLGNTRSSSSRVLPALVVLGAIALGAYASVVHLRGPRRRGG
ncbi:MAG TPA: serine/threonine-protein kinase [Nannocystis sp.]